MGVLYAGIENLYSGERSLVKSYTPPLNDVNPIINLIQGIGVESKYLITPYYGGPHG
jgi:hypothetical protein